MDCQREARRLFRLALRIPTREQSHPGHQVQAQQQGVAERLRFFVVRPALCSRNSKPTPGARVHPCEAARHSRSGLVASDPGSWGGGGYVLPLGRRPSIDNYRFYFPDLPARNSELVIFVLPRRNASMGISKTSRSPDPLIRGEGLFDGVSATLGGLVSAGCFGSLVALRDA